MCGVSSIGGREVIARTPRRFAYLAIILPGCGAQGICPEVCRMPGEVVTIFVIKNAGIVRSVGAIGPARRFHERSILQQISTWTEMDFSVRRNRIVLL